MPNCEACTLKGRSEVPWQYVSEPLYQLLVYGQAPGGTEAITKVPFTGDAGKMCWRLMKAGGFNKSQLNISNICCCVPPKDDKTKRDREPTLEEIECCSDRVKLEISLIKPIMIVALGKVAARTLTGMDKITSIRGQTFPLLDKWEHDCPVFCMLHPSFVMQQRQWIDLAEEDWRKVKHMLDHPNITTERIEVVEEELELTHILDPGPSELAEYFEKARRYTTAYDIETPSDLNPRTAEIIGAAFSYDGQTGVAIDFINGRDERWDIMQEYLEDHSARKSTQNGSFDLSVSNERGIDLQGWEYDTLYAEHTMNSDLPGNLDFLRSRYTKMKPYKPSKREMKTFSSWGKERRLTYNSLDAICTHQVQSAQLEVMGQDQLKVLKQIELPLARVFVRMEHKGVLIDTNLLALMYRDLAPKIEKFEKEVFGPLGLNPRSPIQLREYLGIAETGEDELLYHIKRGHHHAELMQAILDYRNINKTASVYLLGTYNRLEAGRIHTHFKVEGTGTGRPASEDPNLNNVPKWLRVMFAPDPGNTWIEGDYSQQEICTIGVVANEQTLLRDIASGLKIHHKMAKEVVFGRAWDDLTDIEKLQVKAVVFGTTYGRSPRSIAMEFGIATSRAEEWQAAYLDKYPRIFSYRQRVERDFAETGRVTTPFGRVRVLKSLTQAYNTPIQSTSADVTNTTLIELDRQGFDLRLTVYDSIVPQAPKEDAEEVAHALKEVMERPITELDNYKYTAKVAIGDNWCDLEQEVD